MDVKEQIRQYIAENFLFSGNGFDLDDEDSFLEAGVVDSLGVLELVTFVEEEFGLNVVDEEIVPDHFDSVTKLAAYIVHKRS